MPRSQRMRMKTDQEVVPRFLFVPMPQVCLHAYGHHRGWRAVVGSSCCISNSTPLDSCLGAARPGGRVVVSFNKLFRIATLRMLKSIPDTIGDDKWLGLD